MPFNENVASSFRECSASRKALAAFDAAMAAIGGCSNHDCLVNPPKGMGTNGPCKCLDDKHMARRFGTAVRRLRNALGAANKESAAMKRHTYCPERCSCEDACLVIEAVVEEREACAAMCSHGVEWHPAPPALTQTYVQETCAKLARDIRSRK